jgi:hypothetical protein
MFLPRRKRPLRTVLSVIDDLLGGADAAIARHPHRHRVRWRRARRPGAIAPRPAVCISPLRDEPRRRGSSRVGRC